ncbi:MAG: Uncharacterized protein K0R09_2971 [Clostridiales bacterium]|nr:Uncharacterized protein [Clostridiales bacterium]
MIKSIKVNIEEIESMLYFWQTTNDREKVSEEFLREVANMQGLKCSYDEEFNAESVRKVLSAITNREKLSQNTQKESRFWNNNMWMLEDLSYTDSMIQPLKKLNLESLVEKLNASEENLKYELLEVIFSPLHMVDYVIKENNLIINFFKVMPSFTDEGVLTIDGKEIKEYILEKLKELLSK